MHGRLTCSFSHVQFGDIGRRIDMLRMLCIFDDFRKPSRKSLEAPVPSVHRTCVSDHAHSNNNTSCPCVTDLEQNGVQIIMRQSSSGASASQCIPSIGNIHRHVWSHLNVCIMDEARPPYMGIIF